MTSFLPDEIKTKVKERLRDVRFMAREMRSTGSRPNEIGAEAAGPEPGVADFARKLSDFSDNALQTLETVAIKVLSSDPDAHFGEAKAYPLSRYIGANRAAAQVNFARDGYFAAKWILREKGFSNPRVSEELFAAAYRSAKTDWERMEDADAALFSIARNAAIMAKAIMRTRPVQAPEMIGMVGAADPLSVMIYVASAFGLATGVATYHEGSLAAEDPVYLGVCAAVDARYAAMEKALRGDDDGEALAKVFADLIPHLP